MPVKYRNDQFPPKNIEWEKIAGPLEKASAAISRYDSFLGIIPNPQIFVSPIMVQEAVSSSRIEGTRTTAGEVLAYEAGKTDIDPSRENDVREVVNYQAAVRLAVSMLNDIPLSGRVLRAAHEVLLQGVRGQLKSPGKYRHDQNWIGRSYNIEEARYIPIEPNKLEDAMAKWERYVNSDDHPALVKIAVAHAEFESIHPFSDGNGRIGRIVVPLMLCTEGLMSQPCFYLSEFFEHRNNDYQDKLLAVSSDGDWTGWITFFLEALETQAAENNLKARAVFELFENTRRELSEVSNSPSAEKAVECLFKSPVFPANVFTKIDGVPEKTGRRLFNVMRDDMGIVKEIAPHSGQRAAVLVFPKLLEIVEGVKIQE
ncbi:Fic family protein [Olsenella uli]|uniref:Fic family protein n=1 Tax=Olsenella uli TaxID=133926 RepID=UPI00325FA182